MSKVETFQCDSCGWQTSHENEVEPIKWFSKITFHFCLKCITKNHNLFAKLHKKHEVRGVYEG